MIISECAWLSLIGSYFTSTVKSFIDIDLTSSVIALRMPSESFLFVSSGLDLSFDLSTDGLSPPRNAAD